MVRCFRCGAPSIIRTSWTPTNPGRRFYCCSKTCGLIDWYDPEMCPRSKQIIPGLLNSMNQLQAQVNGNRVEAKWVKKVLVISWLIFLVLYFFK
ncbi:hypothetical protein CTI12_AA372150 [Artemisia annua]|uniref:GRF-type domain-containing protein n=1 Tax=Artemisia annua TaxID=35608 RepID=A0A2U1MJY0_ARTAN|nr:hypothetical protein CTI12_AA372150 [Artemisia annua]